MLPGSIGGFVGDTSARLQVSPDYLAVGSNSGNWRYRWIESTYLSEAERRLVGYPPTVYAGLIGKPSSMKSACLGAVLQPVYEIEDELAKAHESALKFHGCASELAEENLKSVKKEAAKKFRDDQKAGVKMVQDATFNKDSPVRKRYILNDATVEKCGELLSENPTECCWSGTRCPDSSLS